ncbi:MAG TPA: hypothetical protein VKB53_05560, partial [Gammaproteobacteria bacterium]|nr:hypothetical protein [Gammaproteobacteria bacterium]
MHCWYDWRTDTLRFTTKTPRLNRGDWLRCGAHRKRDGQPCQARALANGRCKYRGGFIYPAENTSGHRAESGESKAVSEPL